MEIPGSISKGLRAVGYHDLAGRPGFKMAMQVVDDRWYMYLAHSWHRGWSILDMTDPTKPELLRFIDGPANTWTIQVQVADGLMITGLERIGGGIEGRTDIWGRDDSVPYEEGIIVWDVKDPVDPKPLGRFKTGGFGTHRNFYPGGRYVYLCANMKGYKGNIFVVVDIEDPTNPVEVGRWWYPGQWVAGGEKPSYISYHHGPAYTAGNRAFLAYGRAGMIILDIEDIKNPRMVGRLDIGDFGSVVGVHTALPLPERQIVLLTTEAVFEEERDPLNMALVVDIRNETKPKPMAFFPVPVPPEEMRLDDFQNKGGKFGPHNIQLPHYQKCLAPVENTIYCCWESAGLWSYDISNPGLPKVKGYFIPQDPKERRGLLPNQLATQTEEVLVDARGYIYITDKNHGMFILRDG